MNSMSRGYYNDDCNPCNPCKKEKKECPTIIKGGCPSSTTIPTGATAGTALTISSLTLNTSCLECPCARLEFASNIVTTAFTGTISFQVYKICEGQLNPNPIPVGSPWIYSAAAAITSGSTFSFYIYDCDACYHNCCTYTVVATVTGATVGTLSISNATLGAIASCNQNRCC